jgi:site-specific DNA-methyltransferase (adenine-specific)
MLPLGRGQQFANQRGLSKIEEYEDLRREYEDLRRPFNGSKDTPHSDLWTFSPVSDYPGKHPTEKPIALLEHIIKTSTRPGDMVLDFCMGNGTTLKAAQNLGRKAVGIDITESLPIFLSRGDE